MKESLNNLLEAKHETDNNTNSDTPTNKTSSEPSVVQPPTYMYLGGMAAGLMLSYLFLRAVPVCYHGYAVCCVSELKRHKCCGSEVKGHKCCGSEVIDQKFCGSEVIGQRSTSRWSLVEVLPLMALWDIVCGMLTLILSTVLTPTVWSSDVTAIYMTIFGFTEGKHIHVIPKVYDRRVNYCKQHLSP
jgi:hypothetical protein